MHAPLLPELPARSGWAAAADSCSGSNNNAPRIGHVCTTALDRGTRSDNPPQSTSTSGLTRAVSRRALWVAEGPEWPHPRYLVSLRPFCASTRFCEWDGHIQRGHKSVGSESTRDWMPGARLSHLLLHEEIVDSDGDSNPPQGDVPHPSRSPPKPQVVVLLVLCPLFNGGVPAGRARSTVSAALVATGRGAFERPHSRFEAQRITRTTHRVAPSAAQTAQPRVGLPACPCLCCEEGRRRVGLSWSGIRIL